MDYTYKTNRFKLPLLNIVGTTCLNTTFYIAFCFLASEVQESYISALKQLKTLLPIGRTPETLVMDRETALLAASTKVFSRTSKLLLCVWHIQMNVNAHALQHIKDEVVKKEFLAD